MAQYTNCINCKEEIRTFPSRPRKYCSYHCQQKFRWKNYKSKGWIDGSYRKIKVNGKSIREHRQIMEILIGRKLLPTEAVHHKNGNKLDNRLENLELMTRSEHTRMHNLERNEKYFGKNAHLQEVLL